MIYYNQLILLITHAYILTLSNAADASNVTISVGKNHLKIDFKSKSNHL